MESECAPRSRGSGQDCPCPAAASLPVSRGSAIDSELSALMHEFPEAAKAYVDDLFHVDTRRRKDKPREGLVHASDAVGDPKQTHYQETYYKKYQRPRSTKAPPKEKYHPSTVPMATETWQRAEYRGLDVSKHKRAPPVKFLDNYQPPEEPYLAQSSYQVEYVQKPLPAGSEVEPRKDKGFSTMQQSVDHTFPETTSAEHYKPWKPQPNIHFGEIPVFTGSILYPGRSQDFNTETRTSFITRKGGQAVAAVPMQENLKLEGERDFLTTYADVHKQLEGGRPAEMIRQEPQMVNDRRVPLEGVTQSMEDFPAKRGGRQKAIAPLKPTVSLKFDSTDSWSTEQRQTFRGYDVRNHPIPASFRKDALTYCPPTVKFHTDTVSSTDFGRKDLRAAHQPRAEAPHGNTVIASELGKFHPETTTADDYKFRGMPASNFYRHGDFNEAYKWVPKIYKLQGESETRSAFVPRGPAEEVTNYKPVPQAADSVGDHDFRTVYRTAYRGRRRQLNRDQAASLKRELMSLKQARLGSNKKPVLPKVQRCPIKAQ